MPCHRIHCESCEDLYGEAFSKVHEWMDNPVQELGPSHQSVRHDMERTPERVAVIFGERAKIAARDHILLDKRWGEFPKIDKKKVRFPQLEHY